MLEYILCLVVASCYKHVVVTGFRHLGPADGHEMAFVLEDHHKALSFSIITN
jgi:hypothetical protein